MKVNGRRLNGEGSINKVKETDLYRGRIWVEGEDGKLMRIQRYAKTRKEVLAKLRTAKKLAEHGGNPDSKESVKLYLYHWHNSDKTLRPKSIHSRKVNIQRMVPYIGSLSLTELRAKHIETMYKDMAKTLKEDGSRWLSEGSIRQVNAVLRKALKDAVKEGSILYNPIDRVLKQPTVTKPREMETLSLTEVKRLLAINDEWTPLFALLIDIGLRIGEALGLTWDNLDLESRTLEVKRSLQRVVGIGLMFNEPKTNASYRTIPIGTSVIEKLNAHKDRQRFQAKKLGDNWKDQGLVFPNQWGQPMEQSTPYHALQKALRKAKIDKHIRLHDLRHTAASLMIEEKVSPKDVQNILGHSTYAVTMDTYVHTTPEMLRDAVDRHDKAISGT